MCIVRVLFFILKKSNFFFILSHKSTQRKRCESGGHKGFCKQGKKKKEEKNTKGLEAKATGARRQQNSTRQTITKNKKRQEK